MLMAPPLSRKVRWVGTLDTRGLRENDLTDVMCLSKDVRPLALPQS